MAFDNTKSLIRSCVVSTKNGLTVRQLQRDFEDLVGSPIPYQEHGFQSLDLFLHSIPDTVRLTTVGKETLVEHVPDESVARIASLVSRQKRKRKKGSLVPKKASRSRHLKPTSRSRTAALNSPSGDSSRTGRAAFSRSGGGVSGAGSCQSAAGPLPSALVTAPSTEGGPDDMQDYSESEGEGGARPARRARSVAPAGRRLLSAASSSLSISTSNLSGSGRPARAAPTLCPQHRPPRVCRRPSCDALHVCRLYVDGFCPRGDAACRWGHSVASDNNQAALSAHQLLGLSEQELLWMVRAMMPQTVPVTAEEYRSQLAVCPEYAADARCGRSDCFQLHLCPRLASDECRAGDNCRWSHRLTDPDNLMVLLRLRCSELSESQVLARLARPPDNEEGSSDSDGVQTSCTGSGHTSDQQRSVSSSEGRKSVGSGTTATAASSLPSIPRVALSAPKRDSSENSAEVALGMNLCGRNIYPCQCSGDCGQLHLCRLFVASICPYGEKCKRGHRLLESSHNISVLKQRGLEQFSEEALLDAIGAGYLARNPVTDLERRFALQICRPYLKGENGCQDKDCARLHVCDGYVAGTCANGSGCMFSHQLLNRTNAANIRRVGLKTGPHEELVELLRVPPVAKDVWQDLGINGEFAASSSKSSLPVGSRVGNNDSSVPRQALLEASKNVSPKDSKQLAMELDVCRYNIIPSRCTGDCGQLHLCRLFVADICPFAEKCMSGHRLLGSSHNIDMLKERGLEKLSEEELLDAIEAGHLARNPITELERRFALQICLAYLKSEYDCQDENCVRLHVCDGYIAGTCTNSSSCGFSHQLHDGQNAAVIRRVGLKTGSHKELLELLRVSPTAKDVWQDLRFGGGSGAVTRRSSLPVRSNVGNSNFNVPRLERPEDSANGSQSRDPRKCAMEVDLCRYNIHPSLCEGDCGQLHLCRLFVARICPYNRCRSGHRLLGSTHNIGVLKQRGLEQLPEDELLDAIKAGYLARNPITDLERRFALQLCDAYLDDDMGCQDEVCARLHVCEGYVAGTCANGSGCGFSHQLHDGENEDILIDVGLNRLPHKELLKLLADRPSARDVWLSLVSSDHSVVSSSSQTPAKNPSQVAQVDGRSSCRTVDGPKLCDVHASGRRCQRTDCDGFHICGFYLANLCRRPDNACPLGHSFDDAHNQWVLELRGLRGGSPEHFQELIDQMTQRAHITFPNGAEKEVRLCVPYNSKTGCSVKCGRFHVCHRYLGGTCGDDDCPLRHSLAGHHNHYVRFTLGLLKTRRADSSIASVTDRELTELLRARLGVSPGVYESARPASGSGHTGFTPLPPVCDSLIAGKPCSDARCSAVHVCPHFLAGACRRQHCALGHRLDSESNQRALRLTGRAVTSQNHDGLVRELYEASTNVRRSEVYEKLRICISHNRQEGCGVNECTKVHICQKFVAGTCEDHNCDLGHVVGTKRNRKKLHSLGLANVEVSEVLEMLRAVHGVRSAYDQ